MDFDRAASLIAPLAAARQALIYQGFLDAIEPSEHPYHAADPAFWLGRAVDLAAIMSFEDFAPWMRLWDLSPDGQPFVNRYHGAVSSRLAPVVHRGAPAMLKIAGGEEERLGAALMEWFAGDGAARVLARDGPALLLERACGSRSLAAMARGGEDDEATQILCRTWRACTPPGQRRRRQASFQLAVWFRALGPAAERHGGVLVAARAAAEALLAEPVRAAAARRPAPRQCARRRRARLAGHRSQGPDRRARLRLRQHRL